MNLLKNQLLKVKKYLEIAVEGTEFFNDKIFNISEVDGDIFCFKCGCCKRR
jgi:hypothetical protein